MHSNEQKFYLFRGSNCYGSKSRVLNLSEGCSTVIRRHGNGWKTASSEIRALLQRERTVSLDSISLIKFKQTYLLEKPEYTNFWLDKHKRLSIFCLAQIICDLIQRKKLVQRRALFHYDFFSYKKKNRIILLKESWHFLILCYKSRFWSLYRERQREIIENENLPDWEIEIEFFSC